MILGKQSLLNYLQCAVFSGTAEYLWYLPGLIVSLCIVFLLEKYKYAHGFLIVGGLFIVGLLMDTYSFTALPFSTIIGMYKSVFLTSRNGVFFGSIYVYFGMFFAKTEMQGGKPIPVVMVVVSMLLLMMEGVLLYKVAGCNVANISIFGLPVSVLVFLYTRQKTVKINTTTAQMLRKMSTVTYCSHGAVISVFHYFGNGLYQGREMLCFVMIITLVTMVSFFIAKASESSWIFKQLV